MFLSFQEEDRPFTWSSDLHGLTIICFSLVLQVECSVARILTKPIFPSLLSCFSFIHAHMNGGPSRTCVASHFPFPQCSLYNFPAKPVTCPLFLLSSLLPADQPTYLFLSCVFNFPPSLPWLPLHRKPMAQLCDASCQTWPCCTILAAMPSYTARNP